MTPKEKAIQLVNSFDELGRDFTRGVSMKEFSKQCALIAVDELIKETGSKYWYNVKLEIEKL
jgi:hypothetical protein